MKVYREEEQGGIIKLSLEMSSKGLRKAALNVIISRYFELRKPF